MKKILIAALLVLPMACDKMDISPEQAGSFIKFFNTFPVLTGTDVQETSEGYAMTGTAETFTDGRQICLALTDKSGNLTDSIRYFGRQGDDEAYGIRSLSDGGLAILGSSVNPATGYKEVVLIRTDNHGEPVWTKYLNASLNVEARHFEVNDAGSFYLAGSVDTVKTSGSVDRDIWLFGLDENGKPLSNWPKPRRIGGEGIDIANHLQLLPDGKIVLTGVTKSYPTAANSHTFLLITSSIGGVTYAGWIESAQDEEGHCVRSLGSNSFLITGIVKNTSGSTGSDILLMEVNTSLPKISVERFDLGQIGTESGRDLLIGTNSYFVLAEMASASNSRIALISTSTSGTNPVYSYYGESSQLIPGSVIRTSDGGFLISGTNKHAENTSSMALIKVTSDGSF
jgi:hypothetical protein